MRRATPTSETRGHPESGWLDPPPARRIDGGTRPARRIACDLATQWQRGGVIAVCDAIATCGAFGELQREGAAGRGVVASPAGVLRRVASRESRGAARLTRCARGDDDVTRRGVDNESPRSARSLFVFSFSRFLVFLLTRSDRRSERAMRVAAANGRSVRWRGVTSVSRSRDFARRSMG